MANAKKYTQFSLVKLSILDSTFYFPALFPLGCMWLSVDCFFLMFISLISCTNEALKLLMVFPSHRFTTHFRFWKTKEAKCICITFHESLISLTHVHFRFNFLVQIEMDTPWQSSLVFTQTFRRMQLNESNEK